MTDLPFLWSYYDQPSSKRVKREDVGDDTEEKEAAESEDVKAATAESCELVKRKQNQNDSKGTGATFWQQGWRSSLCVCQNCAQMYAEKNCVFLTDSEDTVHFYEEEGRKRTRCESSCSTSSMERGMRAFTQMPHMQQREMLHGYNDLKTALESYLKSFADNGQVVTKEDIGRFFDEFKKEKASQAKTAVFDNCR
jgi:E3 ubiquitin-protein ligase UBR7